MISSAGSDTTGGLRPRKRIITDARKEQNRYAQKLYRQRKRDRVQNRETHRHGLPVEHRQLRPRQPRVALPKTKERTTIEAVGAVTAEAQTGSNHDALFYENASPPDDPLSLDTGCNIHSFLSGNEINDNKTLSPSIPTTSLFVCRDPAMLTNAPGYSSTYMQAPSQAGSGSGPSVSNFPDALVTSHLSLTMFDHSDWPVFEGASPLVCYEAQQAVRGESAVEVPPKLLDTVPHSDRLSQYTYDIVGIGEDPRKALMHALSSQFPGFEVIVAILSKWLYGRRIPIDSTVFLPDPYLNSLQCSLTATILAYLHNARCLGLETLDVLNCISPFYRPDTTATDDPQALLAAARKPWIPIHLQPTLPQILIPHHPYLDLLPFPVFRARAITFAATAPQMYHPMELKKDIFRDGLYCYRHANRQGSKQPWDIGSWEAAPWFLTKWRLLIA